MTLMQQKEKKKEWTDLSKHTKKNIQLQIPRPPCMHCGRKERSDKGSGKQKAAAGSSTENNKNATRTKKRRNAKKTDAELLREVEPLNFDSLGLNNKDANDDEYDDNDEEVSEPPKKVWYLRQRYGQAPHSTQAQGGEQALRSRHIANLTFARALTATTLRPYPKLDRNKKEIKDAKGRSTYSFHPNSQTPRLLGTSIWMNNVTETLSTGGRLQPSRLRREKPEINVISTCKEDLKELLKTTLAALNGDSASREKYDVNLFFGVGEHLKGKLNRARDKRSVARKRNSSGATSIADSLGQFESITPRIRHNVDGSFDMSQVDQQEEV
jgi:hypothetical protein